VVGYTARWRVQNSKVEPEPSLLFQLLGRFARAGSAPGIVLVLGLGDALERGLIGFFVDLGLVVRRLGCAGRLPTALRLRRTSRQCSTAAAMTKILIDAIPNVWGTN
jgi:hypothetical protein